MQDDVETADPLLMNPSEDIASRTKITEILTNSVSVPIDLNSRSYVPSRYLP